MTAKGVILFTATVGALLLCSCAKNEDTSSLTESQQEQSDFPRCIVGEWKCRETPLDNSELYFAPPAGWENMSKKQKIGYFADSYTLKLTYTDNDSSVTLVFDAVNAPNEVKN